MASVDRERIEAAVSEILAAIGEDPGREGVRDTPRRVAEMYAELLGSVAADPAAALASTFTAPSAPARATPAGATPPGATPAGATPSGAAPPGATPSGAAPDSGVQDAASPPPPETRAAASAVHGPDPVLMRDITFRSVCEHHLLPFEGLVHVAYLPAERIAGLGSIVAVVESASSRPQLQERLTDDIADALERGLGAVGVLVVVEARHGCVSARGPRQTRSSTVTLAARGALRDPAARAELTALIAAPRGTEPTG